MTSYAVEVEVPPRYAFDGYPVSAQAVPRTDAPGQCLSGSGHRGTGVPTADARSLLVEIDRPRAPCGRNHPMAGTIRQAIARSRIPAQSRSPCRTTITTERPCPVNRVRVRPNSRAGTPNNAPRRFSLSRAAINGPHVSC